MYSNRWPLKCSFISLTSFPVGRDVLEDLKMGEQIIDQKKKF